MLELILPDMTHLRNGWNHSGYFWLNHANVRLRQKLGLADDCLTQTNQADIDNTREILLNELQQKLAAAVCCRGVEVAERGHRTQRLLYLHFV